MHKKKTEKYQDMKNQFLVLKKNAKILFEQLNCEVK